MKVKITWFGLGFVTAVLILYAVGYVRNHRSFNVVKNMTKEQQEMMLGEYPWLKAARSFKLGPFAVTEPVSQSEKAEAMLSPLKNFPKIDGYPQIWVSENSINIIDSKHRDIGIKFVKSTDEFASFFFVTDEGYMFTDYNLDGQYEVRLGPGSNLAVNYDSKWIPVIFKDKKRYININGTEKEIEFTHSGPGHQPAKWKFVVQK